MLSPSGIYFASNDVEIKKVETVYPGFSKLIAIVLDIVYLLVVGVQYSSENSFEYDNSIAVLPYYPHRDEVVLIRQFRIGALTDKSPWLTEIVAGVMSEYEIAKKKSSIVKRKKKPI